MANKDQIKLIEEYSERYKQILRLLNTFYTDQQEALEQIQAKLGAKNQAELLIDRGNRQNGFLNKLSLIIQGLAFIAGKEEESKTGTKESNNRDLALRITEAYRDLLSIRLLLRSQHNGIELDLDSRNFINNATEFITNLSAITDELDDVLVNKNILNFFLNEEPPSIEEKERYESLRGLVKTLNFEISDDPLTITALKATLIKAILQTLSGNIADDEDPLEHITIATKNIIEKEDQENPEIQEIKELLSIADQLIEEQKTITAHREEVIKKVSSGPLPKLGTEGKKKTHPITKQILSDEELRALPTPMETSAETEPLPAPAAATQADVKPKVETDSITPSQPIPASSQSARRSRSPWTLAAVGATLLGVGAIVSSYSTQSAAPITYGFNATTSSKNSPEDPKTTHTKKKIVEQQQKPEEKKNTPKEQQPTQQEKRTPKRQDVSTSSITFDSGGNCRLDYNQLPERTRFDRNGGIILPDGKKFDDQDCN